MTAGTQPLLPTSSDDSKPSPSFLRANAGRLVAVSTGAGAFGLGLDSFISNSAKKEQLATACFNFAMVFNIFNRAIDICKDPKCTIGQKAAVIIAVLLNLSAAGANLYNALTGSTFPTILVQGLALGCYAYATVHFSQARANDQAGPVNANNDLSNAVVASA